MAEPAPVPDLAPFLRRTAFPIVASTPGARIGRMGRDQGRTTIARILCLKIDHIGDMLVAAPALLMLRKSFAQAEITLICGPWNAGLARRLNIADRIITSDLFAENSMLHLDHEAQERRIQEAMETLTRLNLAPFDLAIDMRRDADSRQVLKLFRADIYAGFGDLSAFPFLDASIPLPRDTLNTGPTSIVVLPKDMGEGPGLRVSAYGLHLEGLARLDIDIRCDAVWYPNELGMDDDRTLGVGVSTVEIRSAAASNGSDHQPGITFALREPGDDRMIFGPGWAPAEPWGRWTSAESAGLTLYFRSDVPEITLTARAAGHSSSLVFPRATVEIAAGEQSTAQEFQRNEPLDMTLQCRAELLPAIAQSKPLEIRAGLIRGTLTLAILEAAVRAPLTLRVLGTRPPHVMASIPITVAADVLGILEVPFEFEHIDGDEPIQIEIETFESKRSQTLAILSVELLCAIERPSNLPIAHVEEQMLDLAAMVALRFAPALSYPADDVGRRLSSRQSRSTATAAADRLARRKAEGRRLIGIAVGANKSTKQWPLAYFHDLCRRFLALPEVDLAFIGGPQEATHVAGLIRKLGAGDRVLDLCSCCRIEDLGEVLVELDGYVGLDTGTTHLAGRVGVKTVALFAYTHHPREWGPVGRNSSWILAEVPCAGCLLSDAADCGFGHRCMLGLTPKEVWPIIADRLL